MDDINTSLRNSTGKMPHATSHIQSVSRAIEMATTEILDLVDAVLHKLDHLEQQLKRSSDYAGRVQDADEHKALLISPLIQLLREKLRGRDDALLKDIERLHAEKIVLDDDTRAEVDAELALFGPIKEMHRIMLALQVQDVTSQQLAVANHLIG